MKFTADRQMLAHALIWTGQIRPGIGTLQAMSGIKLTADENRLALEATNGETDGRIHFDAKIDREGVALVPRELLTSIIAELAGETVIAEQRESALHIRCGRPRFTVRLMELADFPSLQLGGGTGNSVTVKAADLASLAGQVGPVVGTNDARPVLTGVHLTTTDGSLTASATDSYRMARRTIPAVCTQTCAAIVPRAALEMIAKTGEALGADVRITFDGGQLGVAFNDRQVATRLVEGRYPDLDQLVPTRWERTIIAPRADLLAAVRRAAVISDKALAVTPVKLSVTASEIGVGAAANDVGDGDDAVPCELDGAPIVLAFNPRYLSAGLKAVTGEHIALMANDEHKPVRISQFDSDGADDSSFTYIVMPVRI